MLRITLVLLALLLVLPGGVVADAGQSRVMIQLFGWDTMVDGQPARFYDQVTARAGELAALGIDLAWFPPPARSVSRQGYLPGDFYDLGSGQNPTFYGTENSLKQALTALHNEGIQCLADIVVNHRCAGQQDEPGIWNVYHFPSGKAEWENWAICSDDTQFHGAGNSDTGEGYGAAPDVDHRNPQVRADIVDWLEWLKNIGFDGWRYDYVKGYQSASVAEFDRRTSPAFSIGEYWTSLTYRDLHDERGSFVRGIPEYNQDSHRQQLCDWLDQAGTTACVFDFTTKGILQEAVQGQYWRLRDPQGRASGLIGWWPARAVTFIDNHDTGSSQQHWPFPADKVMQGYAYILTHPGTPCIFSEHLYDWKLKPAIQPLIAARRSAGVTVDAALTIVRAEDGLYAARIGDNLAMKLGTRTWHPGEGWTLAATGDQYAVWTRASRGAAVQPAGRTGYYPGYGVTDPDYDYRLGKELSSELASSQWVIFRHTYFENTTQDIHMDFSLIPQLKQSHPKAEVRRTFPFQLNFNWITVADTHVTVKKKLFFRNEQEMGKFKRNFELWRKKKSWLPFQEWELCGQSWKWFEEPVGVPVGTEFKVLD